MTIENTNVPTSIIPKSDEKREKFYKRLNEWIEFQHIIESAQASQKDYMNAIAEDHVEEFPDDNKASVKKRAKWLIDEFLKGKLTEDIALMDSTLGDYSIAEKHLKD